MIPVPESLKKSGLRAQYVLVWQAIESFRHGDPFSFPSNRKILTRLPVEMSLRSLIRIKKRLVALGFLEMTENFDESGRQTSNHYRPLDPWTAVPAGQTVRGEGDKCVTGVPSDIIKAFGFDVYSDRENTVAAKKPPPSSVKSEPNQTTTASDIETTVAFVAERYERSSGRRFYLPDDAEKALHRLISFHGTAGVMALYDLWWKPGRPWSKWAGICNHSIGGLIHDQDKILDDPDWRTLRRKYSDEAWSRGPNIGTFLPNLKTLGALTANTS